MSRDRELEVEIQPEKQDFRQSCTKKRPWAKGSQGLSQVRDLKSRVIDSTLKLGVITHKMGRKHGIEVEGSHYTIKPVKFLWPYSFPDL